MAQRKISRGKKDDEDEEVARILKKYEKEKNFRRLADQLGLSRHRTSKKKSKGKRTNENDGHTEEEETKEDQDQEEDEGESDDDQENYQFGEFSPSEPSPTIPSGSESLSSDLSLPQSFEEWRQKRKPFSSLSQFDDQLTTLNNRLHKTTLGSGSTSTFSNETSDVMRKFYEIQVDKIRTQLKDMTSKYQTTEKKLQEEKQENQTLQRKYEEDTRQQNQLIEKLTNEIDQMKKRLQMEKVHFANLQISDALGEQLSRQDEEDLTIKEYIQLHVHLKIKKHQEMMEKSYQELEIIQKRCTTYQTQAEKATEEISNLQKLAQVKEIRLQHELNLAETSRDQLEKQVVNLMGQLANVETQKQEFGTLHEKVLTLEKENQSLLRDQIQNEQIQQMISNLQKQKEELSSQVILLEKDKKFLQEKEQMFENKVYTLEKTREHLEKTKDNLEQINLKQRQQMEENSIQNRLQFEEEIKKERIKWKEIATKDLQQLLDTNGKIMYEKEIHLLTKSRQDLLLQINTLENKYLKIKEEMDQKQLDFSKKESMIITQMGQLRNDLKMKHFEWNQVVLALEQKNLDLNQMKLANEMLEKKITVHEKEFQQLESTSWTKITSLETILEKEQQKLKEYEQLEVDLDDAVIQTGKAIQQETNTDLVNDQTNLLMSTFSAIPTTSKRRFQQSVLLAQRVVKHQTEVSALQLKLAESEQNHERVNKQLQEAKKQLLQVQQPQNYLIEKLNHREEEVKKKTQRILALENQVKALQQEFHVVLETKNTLQRQLQEVLSKRQDLDTLKETVFLLQKKLGGHSSSSTVATTTASTGITTGSSSGSNHLLNKLMTTPPTPASEKIEGVSHPTTTSTPLDAPVPKWYTKLRS